MILEKIMELIKASLTNGTLWTAIAAIGALITLYFIYKEVAHTQNVTAYQFLREGEKWFSSNEMKRERSKLAKTLLLKGNQYEEIGSLDPMNYFSDLGVLLEKKIAPIYFIWGNHYEDVIYYWTALRGYILWIRKEERDPTYYTEFEDLYHKMVRFQEKKTKKMVTEPTPKEMKEFLQGELDVEIRRYRPDDIVRILELEKFSFKQDAYTRNIFEEYYRDQPQGFFVLELEGEIAGYSIGCIYGDDGEIDSIAIDLRFRKLGLGERLTKHILGDFRERGIKACTLEVDTTNEHAISLYQKLGFEIEGPPIKGYYEDGRDAHKMRANL